MSQQTEFEIVSEAPYADKVLFDNVLSCYDWSKKITATYVLGEAVTCTTWDWVGIFRSDWHYLSDYVSYRWAPNRSPDCTSPRKRSIAFPEEIHLVRPNGNDKYQLIYVSSCNRVTGISRLFKIADQEDFGNFHLMRLFRNVSLKPKGAKRMKRKNEGDAKNGPSTSQGNIVAIKAPGNQKILEIFRDDHSLVDLTGTDFHNKLRIVDYQPVVKEYETLTPTINQHMINFRGAAGQITDMESPSTSNDFATSLCTLPIFRQPALNAIGFRNFLPIKSGPESFLLALQSAQDRCTNYFTAKDLIRDFIGKDQVRERKLFDLTEKYVQSIPRNRGFGHFGTGQCDNNADSLVVKLHAENRMLRERVRDLEDQIATNETDHVSDWVVFEPKRMYRLNKLVVKQGKIICELMQSVEDKTKAITNFHDETMALRKMLRSADERNAHFKTMADDLNTKMKWLLSKHMAERKNEWISVTSAKTLEDTETQTVEPEPPVVKSQPSCSEQPKGKKMVKNKQISKIMCAEKEQPRSKLHKGRREAEQCPTCGLKFSAKTDAKAIEEHILFHDRKQKGKRQ